MTRHAPSPIFCDHCASLALAELDTAPLCERCLLREVGRTPERQVYDLIGPLSETSIQDEYTDHSTWAA